MKINFLEINCNKLPLQIKLKGENGNHVLFILKAAGRKLGAQLIKVDTNMLHLLEQN
jgi:hypothetical protein